MQNGLVKTDLYFGVGITTNPYAVVGLYTLVSALHWGETWTRRSISDILVGRPQPSISRQHM